jgi:hypothetical protein
MIPLNPVSEKVESRDACWLYCLVLINALVLQYDAL